jgi:hypothetical protein
VSLSTQLRFNLARFFTVSIGACSIGWAVFAVSVYRAEANLPDAAARILFGDAFNSRQLTSFKHQLDAMPTDRMRALGLVDAAVIRQRLLDVKLPAQAAQASDFAELDSAVTAALAEVPASSFLWLAKYWLEGQRATISPDFEARLLRMSYWFGPRESWIVVKRNPLALNNLSTLPPDLGEQALEEFVGLVRSRLYYEAAGILAGAGPDVRQKLLSRLVEVSDTNRREFARVLNTQGPDDAIVPGVERPSSRPH